MNETNETPSQEPVDNIDWKDKYLRTLAEMENMRKRLQKERQEMTRFGIENAIGEFLPAIDNFENALRFAENAEGEVKNWAMGFEMILSQFKEVLHNHGVVAFHSKGIPFDAELHEAVEIIETTDHPDGTILHEFTKGYKSHHRTLRAARVKVAKHPQKKTAEEAARSEQELTIEGN
ncbi:MAG: nucleotide exchange factor GrpE [Chlamydiae bacterium]|nr:nucleotide exchange factor GrpE [Chlamydiota bacterium]